MLNTNPLPNYRAAGDIVGEAIRAIAPPENITVSDCAARYRRLNNPGVYVGPWDNARAPWIVEPMDMFGRRGVTEVHFMGPSQISSKSEMLLNVLGYYLAVDPAEMLYMCPSVEMARAFSEQRLTIKFLGQSPHYRDLLGRSRHDDKTWFKSFTTGATVGVIWPSPAQVASRTVRVVLIDERDRMADDLRGEGDPVALVRNRNRMHRRRRKLGNVSSPSREDGSGIYANIMEGDRRLWTVDCLHCDAAFAPGFAENGEPDTAQLVCDDTDAGTAKATAGLACPHCGGVHDSHDRFAMNRGGRWVPLGADPQGRDYPAPASGVVSYWLSGLVSTFAELGELASNKVEAEAHFERTSEETKLRAWANTDMGIPFVSQLDAQAPLRHDEIAARQDDYAMGQVPDAAQFLTAAVDVQKNRFEVSVKAWRADYESWLIARFRIAETETGQPIDPAGHPEHWLDLLPRVADLVFPVVGKDGETLPIASMGIDTGGLEGVIDNARAFWREARRLGYGEKQIRLLKGSSSAAAPDLPRTPSVEKDDAGRTVPGGAPLYVVGVNALKDTVSIRYKRADDGPTAMHLPNDTPAYFFEEMTAETRVKGVWAQQGAANESFDLEVYNLAVAKLLRPDRIDWQNPPWWAVRNPQQAKAARPARRRRNWARGF